MSDSGFAGRLKELREAAGLTQPALAERAGMNRFGVAKLEQGVREPNWTTVLALARALGVEVGAFVVTVHHSPDTRPELPRRDKSPKREAPPKRPASNRSK